MKKINLTIKKDMLSPKFAELATAAAADLKIAVNPITNIPCIYIGTMDKSQLAGRVVEAVCEGNGVTMQELSALIEKPHDLTYEEAGTLPNTALLTFVPKELVKAKGNGYDIQGEIDRITSAGICSKTELEQRIQVMKDNKCSEKIIYDVLKQTKEYDMPVRIPRTIYQNTDAKTKTPILKEAIMNALGRHGLVFEGDKSVGKNVCAETLAWVMGMPYYIISLTKKTTLADISGEKTTEASELSTMSVDEFVRLNAADPAKANAVAVKGQTINLVTEEGELIRWMRNGGLLMVNEMNMGDANLLQYFLNPLADGTGFCVFPGHGRVEMHPDCVLIGSQNAGYTGTCAQNTATLSRLGKITFPYPGSIEAPLRAATVRLGLADEVYKQADKLYGLFHKSVTNGGNAISDNVLNIRGFVRALECYAEYPEDYSLAQAIKCHVAAWAADEEKSIINTFIRDAVTI